MGPLTSLAIQSLVSMAIGGIQAGLMVGPAREAEARQKEQALAQMRDERDTFERERDFAELQSDRQGELFDRQMALSEQQFQSDIADDIEQRKALKGQNRRAFLSGLGLGEGGFEREMSGQIQRLKESRL